MDFSKGADFIPKNPIGNVIRSTDPVGRTTVHTYAPDGIDLLEVRQVNGQALDLIASYTYDDKHQRLTATDASGQTTTFTYNAQRQVETVTTPARAGISEPRTTTLAYDSNGYLQSVTGPEPATAVSFTYDGYGRMRTMTDAASHTLTYDYDALDRVTKVTYPDGTYEETAYNRLDAEKQRDRLGRWTQTFYDTLRRPVATRDASGGTTQYQYGGSGCASCGGGGDRVTKLIDPNGNTTSWEYDLQGRVAQETRADASSESYTYETTSSRLKQKTDRKTVTTTFEYFLDDTLKRKSYSDSTPAVSYTYDAVYPRSATITDGTGTTTATFNPVTTPASLGADRLASIDGPLNGDTISYTYDEMGRIVTRALNGAAVTDTFDALGRTSRKTDPLGAFDYTYVGGSARLSSTTFPNGQTTSYSYLDESGDNRLQEITHRDPAAAVISRFGYTYDAAGSVKTWSQQAGASPAKLYTFGYDAGSQLTTAVISGVNPPPVPSRFAYAYDPAGNRTAEQLDDTVTSATHNSLNALVSTQPGGALLFRGSVNEPSTVTVGGKPAQVASDDGFQGTTAVPSGSSNVVVAATDASGNVRTNTYQVSQSGASKTLTYDSNGNLTGDGARSLEWDAENRLVAVEQGTHRSEFAYNGLGQRVRIVEKDLGAVTSDKRYVWCDGQVCEERDASGSTVVRAFYRHGLLENGARRYLTLDHLGSVREVTDDAGTVVARYDYEPYGRMTRTTGSYDAPVGFTSHYLHAPSGLALPLYRAYAPELGRWTSEDPLDLVDGPNRYAYVRNNPTNMVDPTGQFCIPCVIVVGVIAGVLTGSTANAPGPGDQTWPSDDGGGTAAGAAAGAAAAAAAQAAWARWAPWIWQWVKNGRCIVALHPPHHSFPSMGGKRCWHISITCYMKGCKGSDVRMQIPIPGACI